MLVCQALQGIRGGQSGTAVIEAVEPRLRPGVQALLFQVLRNLGRADALRSQLVARKPPPAADALLCTALALAWDPQAAPYEPFTLVNQAVEAAKRGQATRGQASFINACLRRFLRERDALVAATDGDPVARWNHPAWWIRRLQQDYPADWERILQANNAHAPMALRVNQQKCTLAQYQQALAAINLEAKVVGPQGLELAQPVPVQVLPGFADGWVSVQDAAAQQAAPLVLQGLDLTQPLRVLDACAAPGGKTAHLLEHAPAGSPLQVTALEVDEQRSARIHDTLARLGLSAQVLVADASRPQDWWQSQCGGAPFDAILLDAPCTASGIVRRHPDVRWLRRESDVAQLAQLQRQILEALWSLLKPGGRLLYCTCSVFKAEGDLQIQTFLAHNTNAQLLPSPGHLIPGVGGKSGPVRDNPAGDHDGFFYALLQKSAH
ncbi:16S rRNA (cytosine(967)-C(5))-methyltransferase RsmB [Acidovorax temperans]|nr:16S rRNA (cytosine(967)-C(5))-methyltransferase RsmB [Acidovorax temperans]